MIPDRKASQELLERHRRHLFPAVPAYYGDRPLVVDRARGHTVWDVDGNAYLDFFGGGLTVCVGHGNETVADRQREQLERARFGSGLYPDPVMVQLAERIAALTPGRLQTCSFTGGGSQANETAIAAARQATGNRTVLRLGSAGVGRAGDAMGVTPGGRQQPAGSAAGEVRHIREPRDYHATTGLDDERLVDLCVRGLEEALATVAGGNIAALLAAPVQGLGGARVLPRSTLTRLEPIVREAGGLMIVDEIETGWGRTGGSLCAVAHWGVAPDLMTFATGTANGAPFGCAVATPEVADALTAATFAAPGASPMGVAAALATIEVIERQRLPDNAERQGLRLRMHLEEAAADHAWIGEVRGMGLIQGLEMVAPGPPASPDPGRADNLVDAARDRGLLIGRGGPLGSVVLIAPHLDVDAKEIDDGCERLSQALGDLARAAPPH